MDLAPSAETIDLLSCVLSKLLHCLNYLSMEDALPQADLPGRCLLILEKLSRPLGFYHGFCGACSSCGSSYGFPVSFHPIYADKTSLMTKFKCITFRLVPVFLPTGVSIDNSPHMHALSVPMI